MTTDLDFTLPSMPTEEELEADMSNNIQPTFSIEDLELKANNDPQLKYALELIKQRDSFISDLRREISMHAGTLKQFQDRLSALENRNVTPPAISYASIAAKQPPMTTNVKRSSSPIDTMIQSKETKPSSIPHASERKKRHYVYSEEAKTRFLIGEPVKRNELRAVYVKGFESAAASFLKEMFSTFIPRRSIRNVCYVGHGITQLIIFSEEVEHLAEQLKVNSADPRRKSSNHAVLLQDHELAPFAIDIMRGSQRNADRITVGLYSTKQCLLNEARKFSPKKEVESKPAPLTSSNRTSETRDH